MSEATTIPRNTVRARPNAAAKPKPQSSLFAPKVKPFKKKELVQMFRSLASMLRAQINTADAIKYYAHGHPNKDLVTSLNQIHADVNKGIPIHDAFRNSKRFDDMTIGLIQAGGDAGQLDTAFSELGKRIKSDMFFRKKIRKLIMMPCIVIPILMGAFIASQVKIVPQVEKMMSGMEAKGLVKLSFEVSHVVRKIWPMVVLGMLAIVITIWKSTPVKNTITNLAMAKFRVVRTMIMSLRQMTMLSTIRLLYSNGINLAKSLRVAATSVKKTPFYAELLKAADMYEKSGVPLSSAFAKYTSVDPQVVHMLAIGEKSASLDTQLAMLSEMFEEDAEQLMDDFSQFISLIVMIIAVMLIAAVFLGTFMPIFMMGPQMMQEAM
ncbi:MAG: type II secretion system F family protein [Akkermansiaceae bacterium]|nr:type II secretion system F family protein [Akkermansiaceae bacterium]